jgi:hypothetical protein
MSALIAGMTIAAGLVAGRLPAARRDIAVEDPGNKKRGGMAPAALNS